MSVAAVGLLVAQVLVLAVLSLTVVAEWLELRRVRRIADRWVAARDAVRAAYAADLAGHPDAERLDDEARLAVAAAWEEQARPSAWITRKADPVLDWLGIPIETTRHTEEGHRG